MTFKGGQAWRYLEIEHGHDGERLSRHLCQKVYRQGSDKVMVEGIVQLVCVDAEQKLVVRLPK